MPSTPIKLVLHGDHDLERSRAEQDTIARAKKEGKDLVTIDLSTTTEANLAELLGTNSLFGTQRLIRVHNLEKLRSGKTIAEYLSALETSPDDVMIIIRGAMTPAKKKLFSTPWKLQEFKFPAVLFQFFESLKTRPLTECFSMYRQILETESEWSMHALAARQFRLLLAAKTNAPVLAPPFAQNKLRSQANNFTIAELVQSLHTLYDIERKIKTGTTPLSWAQQFDILLARLYKEK